MKCVTKANKGLVVEAMGCLFFPSPLGLIRRKFSRKLKKKEKVPLKELLSVNY
jgi:hypothetical protein